MKTEKVLISKILIFIVSFVSILCGLFFIISHKTLAAEIITNVDDNTAGLKRLFWKNGKIAVLEEGEAYLVVIYGSIL